MSSDFYARLPVIEEFRRVADPATYAPLPDDWQVVITDVVASTVAIAQGKYKEVNLAGASGVIAAHNALAGLPEVPFVFGGDGASMAVPEAYLPGIRKSLLGVREVVRKVFELDLRVGAVPVKELRRAGGDIRVAKMKLSPTIQQAAFSGGGVRLAEQWIKTPESVWSWNETGAEEDANFAGLECRWEPLRSARGNFICLIALATAESEEDRKHFYESVLTRVQEVLDDTPAIRGSVMNLVCSLEGMAGEMKLKTLGVSAVRARLSAIWALAITRLGGWLMRSGPKLPGLDLRKYRDEIMGNTDHRKFDDALRMVLLADDSQEARLREVLEEGCASRKGAFGLHRSSEALLTCLIFDRSTRHMHFIDGAEGGYVMAAKELKSRMASQP